MIKDEIKTKINSAMKVRDELRVSTLKMLSAALLNAEIAKRPDNLTEEDEMKAVQKEAKKRRDAIDGYKLLLTSETQKVTAQKNIDKEKAELEILKEYLPEEMSDSELENIVSEAIKQTGATSMVDMGKVMGAVMGKVSGRADGNKVSEMVKSKLS
jgi:uncharacterized protein